MAINAINEINEINEINDLLKAGAHLGHKTKSWNPKMSKYLFCAHKKIHIINLEYTLNALNAAIATVKNLVTQNKQILFIGTKRAASQIIAEKAAEVNQPYVNYRWLGGMLTNYQTIRKSILQMQELKQMHSDGSLDKLSKKELLFLTRKYHKLNRVVGGIKNMNCLPAAVFVIDVNHERTAIKEANILGIKVIGIVDSNSNPDGVNYVIPGNDDSIRAIQIYVQAIANACVQ